MDYAQKSFQALEPTILPSLMLDNIIVLRTILSLSKITKFVHFVVRLKRCGSCLSIPYLVPLLHSVEFPLGCAPENGYKRRVVRIEPHLSQAPSCPRPGDSPSTRAISSVALFSIRQDHTQYTQQRRMSDAEARNDGWMGMTKVNKKGNTDKH